MSGRVGYTARGRTGAFEGETGEYVVTIKVRVSYRARSTPRDALDCVGVIAERCLEGAAWAHDWHAARVVDATITAIDAVGERP